MPAFFATLSGIITAVLIVWFAALVGWAWSKARVASFSASARLPLEEDVPWDPATRTMAERARDDAGARS